MNQSSGEFEVEIASPVFGDYLNFVNLLGHLAGSSGPAARLPRVPVRLSLWLL